MLPPWMQKSLTPSGRSTFPTKARLLDNALAGIKLDYYDSRDRSMRIHDSIADSARTFAKAVNTSVGSAFDVLPGEPISTFRDNASFLDVNNSKARKRELELQSKERASIGKDDYLGSAALAIKQTARNPLNFLAEAAGNLLPFIPVATATGGAGALGLGGVMGAGAVRGGIYDGVLNAPEEALLKDKDYASMLALGASPEGARKELANKLASYGEAGGKIALGALLGVATARLGVDTKLAGALSGSIRNAEARAAIAATANQRIPIAVAKDVGKEVFTEGPQEAIETYLGNVGAGAGGAAIDSMEGVVEAGVKGGLMGVLPGSIAAPLEVSAARDRYIGNAQDDARRAAIDLKNEQDLAIKRSDPLGDLVPVERDVPGLVDLGMRPEAISPISGIADGPEAVVFNGYLNKGLSPYNALVEAGYPPTKVTVKLGGKIYAKIRPIAAEMRKIRQETQAPIETAVVEVNGSVADSNAPIIPNASNMAGGIMSEVNKLPKSPEGYALKPDGTPLTFGDIESIYLHGMKSIGLDGFGKSIDQTIPPTSEQLLEEAPSNLAPAVESAVAEAPSVQAPQPQNEEELLEVYGPQIEKYTPGPRNRSVIWGENNPVTAPTPQPGPDMVPSQLGMSFLEQPVLQEPVQELELVDEPVIEPVSRSPLEDIPNQSQQLVAEAIGPQASVVPARVPQTLEEAVRAIEQDLKGSALAPSPRPNPVVGDLSDLKIDPAVSKKIQEAAAKIKAEKANAQGTTTYVYNGEPIEITQEQKERLDLIDEAAQTDDAVAAKAGALRRMVLNRLTDADRQKIAKREARNYAGKRVSVDGKKGEVVNGRGKGVLVRFDNGEEYRVPKEKIKSLSMDMPRTPDWVKRDIDPKVLEEIWKYYNGIDTEQRNKNYQDAEDGTPIVNGAGMIVYNPDKDMSPAVIKLLSKQTELAKTLRNVLIRVSQVSGVTTARLAGLSASGRFLGLNRTNSPDGDIYLNPVIIAAYENYDPKNTARELLNTIIHELAHEKKDPGDHSPEVFGKEFLRIEKAIGNSLGNDLVNYIARSLNMDQLRSMAEQQLDPWNTAFDKAHTIVTQKMGTYKKVTLGKINEGQTSTSVVSEAGRGGDSGKSGKSTLYDRSTGESGNTWKGKVSGDSGKASEGLASRPQSRGSDGKPGSDPHDPVGKYGFALPQWKWWHTLTETWLNKYNRIDQITKHLGDMARSLTPRAAEKIRNLYEMKVRPIEDLLGQNDRKLDDLDLYARAMQAPVRNETIRKRNGTEGGATMRTEEALEIIERFENDEVIKKAHELLMDIAAEQRNILRDSGLVSDEEIRLARKNMGPYYVPLHSEEVDSGFSEFVSGIQVTGRDWRMAKGTTGAVKNVVGALVEQTNRSIVRAQHNAFMHDLADFIKNNKSDIWGLNVHMAPRDKLVEYKSDGEIQRIYIADKFLRSQIQGMSPVELASFINQMRSFTFFYSKLSTKWNPIFPITNFIRDTPMGLARVFSNDGAEAAAHVMKNIPAALKASWTFRRDRSRPTDALSYWEVRARELLLQGGIPSWQGMEDAADIKSDIEKGILAASKKYGPKNIAAKTSVALAHVTSIANETIETGMRLAYFDYLMKQEEAKLEKQFEAAHKDNKDVLKANKDKVFSPDRKKILEIASKVRALTGDFQAQGTVARYMGAFYPFFNASVQGIRAIGQLAVEAGKGNKRAISVFASLAAIGMMEDILNAAVSGDDDDDGITNYDSIPDWVRRQKYVLPTGDGKSIIVPMTYGLSIAVNVGKMISRVQRGAMTKGDFGREMALAVNESSNPLGGAETLTQMVSPLATDWMVQIAENKDWRGNRLFPNRYPGQEWKPNSEIIAKKDSELSKSIARMVNEFTGGSETEKGALANTPVGDITPYPGAIDATTRWLGGGLGRLLSSAGFAAADLAAGEQVDRIPFVSSFSTSPDAYFYKGRFYEQLNEIKQIRAMANGMQAKTRRDELIAKFPDKKKIIEAMTAQELKDTIPSIAKNEILKKNFARIGVKKLELQKSYDEAAKKIKKMEENDVPDKEARILEIVKALNKRYVEAAK